MVDEPEVVSSEGSAADESSQMAESDKGLLGASEGKAEEGKAEEGKAEEGKAEEGKAEEGKAEEGKAEEGKAEGAPDEYADFTLPEGVPADEQAMSDFKDYAKGRNLTQDQAQELVDMHLKAVDKVFAGQMEKWNEQKEAWRAETLSDKELIGSNGTTDEAISIARSAVVKLGGAELQEELDRLGVSNNPRIVKAFWKAGKSMREDDFLFGGGSGDTRSPAERLYPSMRNK